MRRLPHGDQMSPPAHPFVASTICKTRNVPAVDIQIECRVIAEIRRPPNDQPRIRSGRNEDRLYSDAVPPSIRSYRRREQRV